MIHMLSTLALVGFGTVAVVSDLRARTIPNWLTVSLLSTALVLRSFGGPLSLLDGFAGLGLALALAFPLFVVGAFGGGDGKLLMGVGAMLGMDAIWTALLGMALVGGLMAVVEMVRRGALVSTLYGLRLAMAGPQPMREWKTIRSTGSITIPYGVAIVAGALIAWFV